MSSKERKGNRCKQLEQTILGRISEYNKRDIMNHLILCQGNNHFYQGFLNLLKSRIVVINKAVTLQDHQSPSLIINGNRIEAHLFLEETRIKYMGTVEDLLMRNRSLIVMDEDRVCM